MSNRLLRLPEVMSRVGYSRSMIYLKVNQGQFPKPISLGERAVGWLSSDVDDWITKRVALSQSGERSK